MTTTDTKTISRQIEKNWMPYGTPKGLSFIYESFPRLKTVEFSPESDNKMTVGVPTRARPMQGWEIRGGAPPVRVGGNYWHWFHGYRKDGNHFTYCVGVYEFTPEGVITRMTPGSVWNADATKDHLNVTHDKSVIYPCGAMLERGKWVVSAGHQDSEILVGYFDHNDIDSLMTEVVS
jgi:predicted GH43/DUF377 family glycosyl hydrolase